MPSKIIESVAEFESLVVWKIIPGPTKAEVPEPQPGIDSTFDDANAKVDAIKQELEEFAEKLRKQYRDKKIQFSHAKQRYEIEIPEEYVKGNLKPKEFELASTR